MEGKIITPNSTKQCQLCKTNIDDPSNLGEKYQLKDIAVHYYCVLLTYNIQQAGIDEEGILGFLYRDIFNAIQKVKNLKCIYCHRGGASIQCTTCKRKFHLPCSRMMKSLTIFDKNFDTYCHAHRPHQSIPQDIKLECTKRNNDCIVCFDVVNTENRFYSFWMPCCQKNWCHRGCLVKLALSQAYLFKCPICSNKRKFKAAAIKFGIFIPQRDASWELEPGAYDSFRVNAKCDAVGCSCPRGRNHDEIGSRWEILFCVSCGSNARHIRCANLKFTANEWECEECLKISVLLKTGKTSDVNTQLEGNTSENLAEADSHSRNHSDMEISSDFPLSIYPASIKSGNQSDVEICSDSDVEVSRDSPIPHTRSPENKINVQSLPKCSTTSHSSDLKAVNHPVAGPSGISKNLALKSTGTRKKKCDQLINVTSDCSSDESSLGSCSSYADRVKKRILADFSDSSDTSMKCNKYLKKTGVEKDRTRRRCARKSGKRCENIKKVKSDSESDLDVVTIEDSNSPKICKKEKDEEEDEITMIYQKEPVATKCPIAPNATAPPPKEEIKAVFLTIDDKLHQVIQDDGETMVLKYHGNIINRTLIDMPVIENKLNNAVQTLPNQPASLSEMNNQNIANDDIVQIWCNVTCNETSDKALPLSGLTYVPDSDTSTILNNVPTVESNPIPGTSTTQNVLESVIYDNSLTTKTENHQNTLNHNKPFVESYRTTQNISEIQQEKLIYEYNSTMGSNKFNTRILMGSTTTGNFPEIQLKGSGPETLSLSVQEIENSQRRLQHINIPLAEHNQLNTAIYSGHTSITENAFDSQKIRRNYNDMTIAKSKQLNTLPISGHTSTAVNNPEILQRRLNYDNMPIVESNQLNILPVSGQTSTAENIPGILPRRRNNNNMPIVASNQLHILPVSGQNSTAKNIPGILPRGLNYNNMPIVKSNQLNTLPVSGQTKNIPGILQSQQIRRNYNDMTIAKSKQLNTLPISGHTSTAVNNPEILQRGLNYTNMTIVKSKQLNTLPVSGHTSTAENSPGISQRRLNYDNMPIVESNQLNTGSLSGHGLTPGNVPENSGRGLSFKSTYIGASAQNSADPNTQFHSSFLSAHAKRVNSNSILDSTNAVTSTSPVISQTPFNRTYIPSANYDNSSNVIPSKPATQSSSTNIQRQMPNIQQLKIIRNYAISSNTPPSTCTSSNTTRSPPTMTESSIVNSQSNLVSSALCSAQPEEDHFTTPIYEFTKPSIAGPTNPQSCILDTSSAYTIASVEENQTDFSTENVSSSQNSIYNEWEISSNGKETEKFPADININSNNQLTIVISNVHSENPEFIENERKSETRLKESNFEVISTNPIMNSLLNVPIDATSTKSTMSLPNESIRMCAVTGQVRKTSLPNNETEKGSLKDTDEVLNNTKVIENSTRKRKKEELISEDTSKRKCDEDIIISDDEEVIDID